MGISDQQQARPWVPLANQRERAYRDVLTAARAQVFAAADLHRCQDNDPNTSVDVNVAILRATYDGILTSFGQTLGGILTDAQQAFDQLVATAQPKQKKNEKDDDEDEADDD